MKNNWSDFEKSTQEVELDQTIFYRDCQIKELLQVVNERDAEIIRLKLELINLSKELLNWPDM